MEARAVLQEWLILSALDAAPGDPPTPLLEGGDALDANVRRMGAGEIEEFRRQLGDGTRNTLLTPAQGDAHMAAKKRVFISFDYDNDEGAKTMLAGQAKLADSPFDFTDASVKDHLSGDWKDKVSRRMDNVDLVIVLCGTKTHQASGVAAELSIAQGKPKSYFLLAAYSDKTCTAPTTAKTTDKIYKWTWENLKILVGGGR